MANKHGLFWNSQDGDRVYDANDFSEWLKKFYTTGVFNGDLAVTASGGMTVSVSSGYVNIEGKVKFFSTPTTLTIATAGGKYERIDTVVAECNYSDREITVKVVTGAYSTSPKATAPVRTAAAYQLVLAEIDVAVGATEITQKNITDKRMDSNVCGLVTGTVSQIDFSTVKAQFDSWFEDVKGTLDSDAAGNLKNQIDTNASNIATNTKAIDTLNNSLIKKLTKEYTSSDAGNILTGIPLTTQCIAVSPSQEIDDNTRYFSLHKGNMNQWLVGCYYLQDGKVVRMAKNYTVTLDIYYIGTIT